MQIIVNALLSKIKEYNPELNEAQINSRRFGLETLVNELSKALIYLIIAAIFSLTGYYLLSLFIYSTLRLATGGYHAKSYIGCLVSSFIVFAAAIFAGQYVEMTVWMQAAALIAAFVITLIFAPVKHKNTTRKNLANLKRYRLLSLVLVLGWSVIALLLPGAWGITAVVTILIEALMQPLGKLFNPAVKIESGG